MQSERFKKLAKQFLQRTHEELVQLQACLPQAQQGDPEALLVMLHVAHRVNGSGAMLGFKDIGEVAAHIEGILRRTNNAPSAEDWPDILLHIGKLSAALQCAVADDTFNHG